MDVQAAVGVEAEEAAALGLKSRSGLGGVREPLQAQGVTYLREVGHIMQQDDSEKSAEL